MGITCAAGEVLPGKQRAEHKRGVGGVHRVVLREHGGIAAAHACHVHLLQNVHASRERNFDSTREYVSCMHVVSPQYAVHACHA